MLAAVIIASVMAAPVSQTAPPRGLPAAVVSAVDYCMSVAQAELTQAAPVTDGPEGFVARPERYGALAWVYGEGEEQAVRVSPGEMCSVIANSTDGLEPTLLEWVERHPNLRAETVVDNNRYYTPAEGGNIRIAWSIQPSSGLTSPLTWVLISALKMDD